ncbi:hypothetical protein AVEN_201903-1, partial [Araneus ventricosus]
RAAPSVPTHPFRHPKIKGIGGASHRSLLKAHSRKRQIRLFVSSLARINSNERRKLEAFLRSSVHKKCMRAFRSRKRRERSRINIYAPPEETRGKTGRDLSRRDPEYTRRRYYY